jgi:preprotein translocase subunit SecG
MTTRGGIAPAPHAVTLSPVIWIVASLQISSALTLVFLVLLHSGKGGGLSDMFGGGAGAAAAGSTVVERNLDRITVVAAVIFFFTSVAYALIF